VTRIFFGKSWWGQTFDKFDKHVFQIQTLSAAFSSFLAGEILKGTINQFKRGGEK